MHLTFTRASNSKGLLQLVNYNNSLVIENLSGVLVNSLHYIQELNSQS